VPYSKGWTMESSVSLVLENVFHHMRITECRGQCVPFPRKVKVSVINLLLYVVMKDIRVLQILARLEKYANVSVAQ
jgi:hypothetical protein